MAVYEVEAVFTVEAEDADAAYRAVIEMLSDPATWPEDGRAWGAITGWEPRTEGITPVTEVPAPADAIRV